MRDLPQICGAVNLERSTDDRNAAGQALIDDDGQGPARPTGQFSKRAAAGDVRHPEESRSDWIQDSDLARDPRDE